MNYLSPSEYETYGLEATTPAAWVLAASTVIDAHCRRATLGVAQYDERLRIAAGRNTVRVTYVPLAVIAPATTPIVSVRGRYAIPRRGEWPFDAISSGIALTFGLPGTWNAVDPAGIDVYADTGEVTLPVNAVGLGYSEIDLAYTAGLAAAPASVEGGGAPGGRPGRYPPAAQVKSGRVDCTRLEFFCAPPGGQTPRAPLGAAPAREEG